MIVRKYAPEYEIALFALLENEEEWKGYWHGAGKTKYQKALANSIVYVIYEDENLCGYVRCRDDDGFGVYVYDPA